MEYNKIIEELKKKTDEVILFHSGTGKDSIMLLDLCSKNFKKVHCVFMYIVKGLQYENNYINWAKNKYSNVTFQQTPHYAVYSFLRNGYLGINQNPNIKKTTIANIDLHFRKKLGLNYSIYGFKKVDGITRRFMLNDCINGMNEKTNKVYPLMNLKNSDVLNYIRDNKLIPPFNYGTKKPSSGCDISTPEFLQYLSVQYPNDLKLIFAQFPMAEAILFKYREFTLKK